MKFYEYDQNNSGGRFRGPAYKVYIEAPSAKVADSIAESQGLYFDGCERGEDCDCCGDRWDRASESDYRASESPPSEPLDMPSYVRAWADEAGAYMKVIRWGEK